jgi:hypothetical protein
MQQLFLAGFVGISLSANRRDDLAQSAGKEFVAKLAEVVVPADLRAENGSLPAIGRVHNFDVLQVIGSGA